MIKFLVIQAVVLPHEFLHWLPAKLMGLNPIYHSHKVYITHDECYWWQYLIILLSPLVVGFTVLLGSLYLFTQTYPHRIADLFLSLGTLMIPVIVGCSRDILDFIDLFTAE